MAILAKITPYTTLRGVLPLLRHTVACRAGLKANLQVLSRPAHSAKDSGGEQSHAEQSGGESGG